MRGRVAGGFRGGCSLHVAGSDVAPTHTASQTPHPAKRRTRQGPNKTETAYRDACLRGHDARYEALTFRLANGHRYTPDWVVFESNRPVECHEVKGAYALHSQQRARLAFDQARVEFSGLGWRWATQSAHGWEVA